MYRLIKNMLRGRKKVKNVFSVSKGYEIDGDGAYHPEKYQCSLSYFIDLLRKKRDNIESVTWRETFGWEPRVKFSWDKPQRFSPQEAADYIERRNLLSDCFNHFEGQWQVYSGRGQEQHYFDVNVYHTIDFLGSTEIGRLKKKISIDCLLRKDS